MSVRASAVQKHKMKRTRTTRRQRRKVLFFVFFLFLLVELDCVAYGHQDEGSITPEQDDKPRRSNLRRRLRHHCHDIAKQGRRPWKKFPLPLNNNKRERDIETSYSMAVLATMAYYPFHHRKRRQEASTGFRLVRTLAQRKWVQTIRSWPCSIQVWWRRKRTCAAAAGRLVRETNNGDAEKEHDETGDDVATRATIANGNQTCRELTRARTKPHKKSRTVYTFHYFLFDWFETTTVPGVNYHDTDLLVSTASDGSLVIAFAGTASAADHVTNVQTFEPAAHSGFFHGGTRRGHNNRNNNNNTALVQGSIHRGIFNAYSRVERGSVLRLSNGNETNALTRALDKRYGHCVAPSDDNSKRSNDDRDGDGEDGDGGDDQVHGVNQQQQHTWDDDNNSTRRRVHLQKNGVCRCRNENLMVALRELVMDALLAKRTVHISGHSLGLHLWTFGAPQVADDVFLNSAMKLAPRLRSFVKRNGNGLFHRFVTLSDSCNVDFVSNITERALPSHRRNFRGRAARRLGGVRGTVVHFAEPYFLLPPLEQRNVLVASKKQFKTTTTTTTRSAIDAHSTVNYVRGISRESLGHPLFTDLPVKIQEWLGDETIAAQDDDMQ